MREIAQIVMREGMKSMREEANTEAEEVNQKL